MSAPTFELTTASPAHSATSSNSNSSAESIQPIHNGHEAQQPQGLGATEGAAAMGQLGAKGFLMKKMAASGQNFHSPTDTMVSPCTKKLAQSKQRHFTKGKPLSLSSSFQAQAAANNVAKKPSGLGQSTLANNQEVENSSPF
ncbi:hypothetical protein JCM11641_002162 [Rhodosporidiobolus odoratus]